MMSSNMEKSASNPTVSIDLSASALDPDSTLSKNQLKKLRRSTKWQAVKEHKKSLKKKRKSDDISDDKTEETTSISEEDKKIRLERKLRAQQEYLDLCDKSYGVVIDCDWESEHTDSTMISLVQQLAFCYGINKRSDSPSRIFLTGLGPRTKAQLLKNNSQNWRGVVFSDKDYLELVSPDSPSITEVDEKKEFSPEEAVVPPLGKELVYLTSDATEVLESLDPNCAYIIGGIVDRNRLKGATYNKAVSQGIRTAKLPIRESCQLKTTHVLTINHVFDILKRFDELQSWPAAIERVIPTRKKGELAGNVAAKKAKTDVEEGADDDHSGNGSAEPADGNDDRVNEGNSTILASSAS